VKKILKFIRKISLSAYVTKRQYEIIINKSCTEMWEKNQCCCCSIIPNETRYTQRNIFINFYSNTPNKVMQSRRTTSLVFLRVSNLVLLLLVATLLTLSGCNCHPHIASITRLPIEFANHQPHHQTDDPAFRVFYGTGVSLFPYNGVLFVDVTLMLRVTSKLRRLIYVH
jgi:hypothetical protein